MTPSEAALLHAARHGDWFRRGAGRGAGPYTEWSHFVVLAPGLTVLANVTLAALGADGVLTPTLLLAIDRGGWIADLEVVPLHEADLRAGRHDCVIGASAVTLGPAGYRLTLRAPRIAATVDLTLVPEALPLLASNAPMAQRGSLSWLAVPRLRASGTVEIAGERLVLTDAPAYHDRNWGEFAWDGDFAWEWGFCLPPGPARWSILFLRFTDRARHRVLRQGVWLWRGSRLVRGFRDTDVRFSTEGFIRTGSPPTVPRALGSLAHGSSGIPAVLSWQAEGEGDRLSGRLGVAPPLRIIAPATNGFTVVHEAPGTLELHGTLDGEELTLVGPALLEVANA